MNEIDIVNKWINYAYNNSPDKLPMLYLLLDYTDKTFSESFYKNHANELKIFLSTLDKEKSEVQQILLFIKNNYGF